MALTFALGIPSAQATLLSHWKLDETEGETVQNEVGDIHGTNYGALINQEGIAGSAYQFDGIIGNWIDTDFHPIPAEGDFSAFMWINAPFQTGRVLMGANFTQAGRWTFQSSSGGNLFFFHNPTGNMVSDFDPFDEEWHHVGMTRAGQVITIWMDGVGEVVAESFSGVLNTDFNFTLGARFPDTAGGTNPQGRYMGLMDDVQLYDAALNTGAVEFLYQNPGQVFEGPLAVPGDYDGNGTVDAADYVAWRDNQGATGDIGTVAGDGTGDDMSGIPDGDADQFDYDFWRQRFGASAAAVGNAAAGAVPEPGGLLSFIAALALAGACNRGKR